MRYQLQNLLIKSFVESTGKDDKYTLGKSESVFFLNSIVLEEKKCGII